MAEGDLSLPDQKERLSLAEALLLGNEMCLIERSVRP